VTKRESFVSAMAMLSGAFSRILTEEAVAAYWLVLEAIPAPDLAIATKRALAECRFMPTPAELLDLAGAGGARALAAETAEAWGAVRSAMDRHDYTTSVDFGPLVNAVVSNLGGWQFLCGRSLRDLVWDRKKFEELYAAFRAKPVAQLPAAEPCRGAFGGAPVPIAIGGRTPPKMIGGASGVIDVVHRLAEEKARPPGGDVP
jgi:hypothetical protein